jgi:predicted O-linked N-acetylglucosamine transferase (SPINDLY family)
MAHHRAGRLADAEALYRHMLEAAPGHVDALYLLSVIACQSGQFSAAVELTGQALPHHPDIAELHATRANAFAGLRQFEAALASFDRAIQLKPEFAEAFSDRGNTLYALNQYQLAVESFDRAIALQPGLAAAYANRGNALNGLGQFHEALKSCDQALQLQPNLAEAHSIRGNALYALEQYRLAVDSFDRAVALKPGFAEALCNRGSSLHALGQYQAAVDSFDLALRLDPSYADAHANRGNSLNGLKRHQAALASFDQALRLDPHRAETHNSRANALFALGQPQAALESLDLAIQRQPDFAGAWKNRGSILNELQQYQAALASFDRAIQLNPRDAETHSNRASALHALHQYQEAIESSTRALRLDDHLAEAWNNRGNSFLALQQYRLAQQDFEQCLRIKPDFAEALNNLGAALYALDQYPAALDAIDRAIQLQPDFAEAYNNRGNVQQHLEQYPAAFESFTHAKRLNPGLPYVAGMALHAKRYLCDWQDLEADCREVEARIERNQSAAIPFTILAFTSSPALERKAAEIYTRDRYPGPATNIGCPVLAPLGRDPAHSRIRIGYFSADFYNHATSYLIAELFERHDRSRFEVFGFSFGPDRHDAMRQRVSAAMDRFLDVRTMPDSEVAQLARSHEIDIAIDLKGFTREGRPGIFAHRAAPIQVNYLGYPGTMAAPFIDYLIADPTVIPESAQHLYAEKIVYLPDTYQVNDSRRGCPTEPGRPIHAASSHGWGASATARVAHSLPETGFVFCCFNNANKLSPSVFDQWMRILAQVPGSILWLLHDNPWAAANLRNEAAGSGIDPERLIFAKHLPLADHLAREQLADLFLDTFPYTAHTTASDALWAGVPVLTRIGETFASRVAASLLRAIDLPELITTSPAEYEHLAIELALDPERLRGLRERLARNRLTTALFDTAAFTRHIEAAYTAMHSRYQAGQLPDHIHIPCSAAGRP